MFIKAKYIGFYPLGSEIEINGIKIMQHSWNIVQNFRLQIGRCKKCSVCGQFVYKVIESKKTAYFSAVEYGYGHYHVFIYNKRAVKYLMKCKYSILDEEYHLLNEFYDTYPRKLFQVSKKNFCNITEEKYDLEYSIDDYLKGYTTWINKKFTKGIILAYNEGSIIIDKILIDKYLKIMTSLSGEDFKIAKKYYDLMNKVIPVLNKYIVR